MDDLVGDSLVLWVATTDISKNSSCLQIINLFFAAGGQGQRKSGQLCLVLVRPDRQTTDTIFRKIRTKTRQGQDTDRAVRRRLPISVTITLAVSADFDIRNGILKSINQCSVVIFLVSSSGRPERRTDQLDFDCSCYFPVLKRPYSGLHGLNGQS